jgi:ABC-type branched-subunit amino acid transport system substrate-binding protein
MNLRLGLLFTFFILASCNTIATKHTSELNRPQAYPSTVQSGGKKKSVSGMSAGKAPTQQLEQAQTPAAQQDPLQYVKDLVTKSVAATTKQEQESYRLKAVEVVESKLNDDQLDKVASDSDFGFLRGHAMYRLGEKALTDHDTSKAKKYFNGVIDYLPGSDLAARAQDIVSQLEAARNVESKTVGVVLPLSGKNAPVGQRALRGLEMGLGLNIPGSNFKLAVMDSEGNPDSARRGVEKLVKEDNVIAIVGSLLSKTAPAVASKSDELGVPSIALSQRSGITDIGPSVFRNSLTSGMQIRELVRTCMEDMGMKKFGILYPNDPYGVEFANIFWDEVLARGGEITAVQSYSNKETDFRLVIQRLAGNYYGEARQDEFNVRLKEMQAAEKKKSSRNSNLDTVLQPITDFDALFIPDSAKSMGQIAAMLAYSDVRNVRLLGTNLWNTSGLAKRAGNFADHLVFVDSVTPNANRSRFFEEYKNTFKEEPSLIEAQAYDAGLILRQLIASGASSREELARKLTDLKKFPGALGTLNMSSDREIERPVSALTVQKGEVTPLKVLQ